jgi:hypothetical protein
MSKKAGNKPMTTVSVSYAPYRIDLPMPGGCPVTIYTATGARHPVMARIKERTNTGWVDRGEHLVNNWLVGSAEDRTTGVRASGVDVTVTVVLDSERSPCAALPVTAGLLGAGGGRGAKSVPRYVTTTCVCGSIAGSCTTGSTTSRRTGSTIRESIFSRCRSRSRRGWWGGRCR